MVPEVRFITIPEWKLNEPNEVILSVTNRCENDLNISFVSLNETESHTNLSNFVSTASIAFKEDDISLIVDKQDSSKPQIATLREADLSTNGFVVFRRDNKIGIVCHVTPKVANSNVRVVFGLKHHLNVAPESVLVKTEPGTKSEPTTPQQAQPAQTTTTPIFQHVYIDFGPVRKEDGLKSIPRPKYIDDCLSGVNPSPGSAKTPQKQAVTTSPLSTTSSQQKK